MTPPSIQTDCCPDCHRPLSPEKIDSKLEPVWICHHCEGIATADRPVPVGTCSKCQHPFEIVFDEASGTYEEQCKHCSERADLACNSFMSISSGFLDWKAQNSDSFLTGTGTYPPPPGFLFPEEVWTDKVKKTYVMYAMMFVGTTHQPLSPIEWIHAVLASRNNNLQELAQKVKDALEKIVCTEEPDAGLLLVSTESDSRWDEKLKCNIYKHRHFSEMGDHLIALHRLVSKYLSPEAPK